MLHVRIQTEFLTRIMSSSDVVARILAGRERVVRGQKVPGRGNRRVRKEPVHRADDLRGALAKAAALPLNHWFDEDEEEGA